jgi:hypothetical protein
MSRADRSTGRTLLPDADDEDRYDAMSHEERQTAARHRRHVPHTHRQSRQAVFDTVHAMRNQGLLFSEIASRTGYGRRRIVPPGSLMMSCRTGAEQPEADPRLFEEYLAQRWQDGIRRGRDLFHEIKLRGYTGSFSNLERLLARWRRTDRASRCSTIRMCASTFQHGHVPDPGSSDGPLDLAGRGRRVVHEAQGNAHPRSGKESGCPETDFTRFRGAALPCAFEVSFEARTFRSWRAGSTMHRAQAFLVCSVRAYHTSDIDAVRNAIEFLWSTGQIQGHINRLRILKRAMYGRAGTELLTAGCRRSMSSITTQSEEDPILSPKPCGRLAFARGECCD